MMRLIPGWDEGKENVPEVVAANGMGEMCMSWREQPQPLAPSYLLTAVGRSSETWGLPDFLEGKLIKINKPQQRDLKMAFCRIKAIGQAKGKIQRRHVGCSDWETHTTGAPLGQAMHLIMAYEPDCGV